VFIIDTTSAVIAEKMRECFMALLMKLVRQPKFKVALGAMIILIAFVYGILVGRYKIFPYQQVDSIMELISPSPYASFPRPERQVQMFKVFGNDADIVFIGDSHTEFGMWDEYFPTRTIANRGVHSNTTGDVLARMDTILSTNATVAYVMLGINDIFVEFPLVEIIENYREIIRVLKNNDIEVIIQSTVQCHSHYCAQDTITKVNALNERLEKLAKDEDIDFLNLGGLSDHKGLVDEMTYDGIHLTAVGYQVWLSKIAEHIGN